MLNNLQLNKLFYLLKLSKDLDLYIIYDNLCKIIPNPIL